MANAVLSDLASFYAAVKAAAIGSGFAYVEVSASILQLDFSGDASFQGTDNSILVEIRYSSSRFQMRACRQPVATTTFTRAKSLFDDGNTVCFEWVDFGAIGDQVSYTEVTNLFAIAPVKVQDTLNDCLFVWKGTSPYDAGVRFYVASDYEYCSMTNYVKYMTKCTQMSPSILDIRAASTAYRTVAGDGLTMGSVVYQTTNGMVVDFNSSIVAWRSDLSLQGADFTIGGKTYHYCGTFFHTDSNQVTGSSSSRVAVTRTGGWNLAYKTVN